MANRINMEIFVYNSIIFGTIKYIEPALSVYKSQNQARLLSSVNASTTFVKEKDITALFIGSSKYDSTSRQEVCFKCKDSTEAMETAKDLRDIINQINNPVLFVTSASDIVQIM